MFPNPSASAKCWKLKIAVLKSRGKLLVGEERRRHRERGNCLLIDVNPRPHMATIETRSIRRRTAKYSIVRDLRANVSKGRILLKYYNISWVYGYFLYICIFLICSTFQNSKLYCINHFGTKLLYFYIKLGHEQRKCFP